MYNCCGATEGSEQQHDQDLKEIYKGGRIGHFTVMDGSEAKGDLVLIQTFFALLWKLFLKNTS